MAFYQSDYALARACYEECLALQRQLADEEGAAATLNSLGGVAYCLGDHVAARAFYEEGLAAFKQLGDQQGVAAILEGLAFVQQGA